MVEYTILYSKKAQKDAKKLSAARLDAKAKEIIVILQTNPFQKPPPYESLVGDFKGLYSRRINIQHRLVYDVNEEKKVVRIHRMWTHYGE